MKKYPLPINVGIRKKKNCYKSSINSTILLLMPRRRIIKSQIPYSRRNKKYLDKLQRSW